MVCLTDGSGWRLGRDCDEWDVACASDGYCEDACADSERAGSNVGCEYWGVPLPNEDSQAGDFAIVVTNDGTERAQVRLLRQGRELEVVQLEVGETRVLAAPYDDRLVASDHISSVVEGAAFRILSDQPILAAQFNPLEYSPSPGSFSYSSDASLLLPAHSLDSRYTAVSYVPMSIAVTHHGGGSPPGWFAEQAPGYIAVVGTDEEPTRVSIRPRAPIYLDAEGTVRHLAAGEAFEMTLRRGDVGLITNVPPPRCEPGRPGYTASDDICLSSAFEPYCRITEACREEEFDLTGTRIEASRPIAAFAGHACAFVPYNRWACDHLEEQLVPDSRLGRVFASTAIGVGGASGPNLLRVVSVRDDTEVQFQFTDQPEQVVTLGAGEHIELPFDGGVRVEGTKPITAVQFMIGQSLEAPAESRGDPSMLTLVPQEQFRTSYNITLPESYRPDKNGQNYLLIVRTPEHPLHLDGEPLDVSFERVGDLEVGVVPVSGGAHTIDSPGQYFGVSMFGLGTYTSYATVAGLGLKPLLF